jgi:plastocyanin
MNASRPRGFVIVALLALGIAACGGGHGSSSTKSSSTSCATKAGATGAVSDTGSKAATGSTVDVQALDVKFSPTCTTSVPAGVVTLTVHNSGSMLHNVSIPDQHIDRDVQPNATITVHVQVGKTAVVYFCKYHRVSGMVGVLTPQSS